MIKKEFQGKNLSLQIINVLFDKAFNDFNLHKIWCLAWEDNPKTIHLYKDKANMQIEGRLIDEYWHNNKWHNMVRFYKVNPNDI